MLLHALLTVSIPKQDLVKPPEPLEPVPSERQLAWHELEYYGFLHFGLNTFTGVEWGSGREDPNLFQPSELDCGQWARVAKTAGMRGLIVTAKHHDGFCLWPSKRSPHSVASSSWKGGKGDVLRELSEACRAEGLRFGVYLSPWDRHEPTYGDSPRYNEHFKAQLAEALSGYGPVFEVWFDGACGEGPNGKRQVYDWPGFIETVREHQPDAVIFSDAGPDIRWVGNERGYGDPTNWCLLRRDEFEPGTPRYAELTRGHEDGTHWLPAEADVSIRKGWFYSADDDAHVKSVDDLVDIWYGSVGRGTNLLLNLPPDRRGRIHETDVERLVGLRAVLDATFDEDLARGRAITASETRGNAPAFGPERAVDGDRSTYWATDDGVLSASLEVELDGERPFNRVLLREHVALGQRVRSFALDIWDAGKWRLLAEGTTIGVRRILRVPTTSTTKLRLTIRDARACPTLADFELYQAP